ncbi:probable LRR receptor-like serine/threonine-protein kinase At3g47570 [Salvia miltiorrhiza]|uniref:probable LRR receptor-like serine/threonine-protein kinase At3g47570 n=1 Tax=Salvia miltiorrhiza TaxID=226208 RepID=UPI0025AC195B|nr:probable LRR receptor-like serine/threonine-protein kinase At3g47570 [Salvia miltiorrhiza]
MVAHVADFGLAKHLSVGERMLHSRTLGTVGYIAPEYGSQGLISTAVDVYSYGILLMEMLSRRKPTDEMFSGELTLRGWVSESFPDSVLQIVDNELLVTGDDGARAAFITCLTLVIGLALECTADLPEERPNMNDVQIRMTTIRYKYVQMSLPIVDPERAGNFIFTFIGMGVARIIHEQTHSTNVVVHVLHEFIHLAFIYRF